MEKETKSILTVTFTDGEVKEYLVDANRWIASHLANKAYNTGFLTFRDRDTITNIPVGVIREWSMRDIPDEKEPDK